MPGLRRDRGDGEARRVLFMRRGGSRHARSGGRGKGEELRRSHRPGDRDRRPARRVLHGHGSGRDGSEGGRGRRPAALSWIPMEQLTIGELAKRARVNRETVRYYERRRLLQRASRSISGYRIFSDDALRRLRFIRGAKVLGFSLTEIKELLGLRVNSAAGCDRVRERTQVKIADIDQKIRALRQMKGALAGLVIACARRRRTNE